MADTQDTDDGVDGEQGDEAVRILLVEDNPGDVKLTEKALSNTDLVNDLHVVRDGVAAMDFVHQRGDYTDAPRPDIILLDLNLPKLNGDEVLERIKEDDDLRRIPIVMLTSSDAEEDILSTYDKHANAYLTKPVNYSSFLGVVERIEGFWFSAAEHSPK